MEKRYTPKEACDILGLSYCYLLQRVKAGDYQHHRLNAKHIFFTEEDLELILKSSLVRGKNSKTEEKKC